MAGKRKTGVYILLGLLALVLYFAWRIFGSNTSFAENKKNFYINTESSFSDVITNLRQQNIINNTGTFSLLAKQVGYDKKMKPGKYVIEKGTSIFNLLRMLKSGRQSPVSLVINKLRTKENFAKKIGTSFECDSSEVINFLNNSDSLRKYQLDTNVVMTAIIPNTYNILWNTPMSKIFKRLYDEHEIFWNDERKEKAVGHNLTPLQAYILASIVEEETNMDADKGKIASVYLNRLETGMRLGADPTVKFAMKDFGLKRIYHKHLAFQSPYNTYLNSGLPPGPICTPSSKTIDAVLNSPSTSYLYFVAKPELNGYSNFATNYTQHLLFAKAYQFALDSIIKVRSQKTIL